MTKSETRAIRSFVGMRFQQALALLPLLGAFLGGCRKDAANGKPGITIISPAEGASFTLPDTLAVTVEATDDIGLERVAVTMVDQDGIPVVAGVSAPATGTSATVTLALPVTGEQVPGGTYRLLATASDGHLTGKDWRSLHITAAPLRLRAVFTLAEAAPGNLHLYRTDSAGQTALANTWAMDLAGAAVSSAAQRLVVAGGITGGLTAFATDGPDTAWGLPNPGTTGQPWFTGVDLCADGRLYTGLDDGTIHAYNPVNGTGETVITLPAAFRARQAATTGELLVSTERRLVTGEHRVGVYFRQSGAPVATQPLGVDPVGLFVRDAGHVLIFGNGDGQGRVLDRTLDGGGTWEAFTWPAPITAVERVAGLTWLVALANGDLQRFTYNNAGSLSIGTTPVLSAMAYDATSGLVYGGADGQVILINPFTGTTTEGWTVDGTVRKVLPLFNREP